MSQGLIHPHMKIFLRATLLSHIIMVDIEIMETTSSRTKMTTALEVKEAILQTISIETIRLEDTTTVRSQASIKMDITRPIRILTSNPIMRTDLTAEITT